jgi:hypothetical protein
VRLKSVGIFQAPRVSLINISDCNPETSS